MRRVSGRSACRQRLVDWPFAFRLIRGNEAALRAARPMLMHCGIKRRLAMIRTMTLASLCFATFAGCAADTATQPAADELGGENGDGEAAKADAAHDTFGFVAVEKDGAF